MQFYQISRLKTSLLALARCVVKIQKQMLPRCLMRSKETVGAVPQNKLEFTVVLENVTSNRNYGNATPTPSNRARITR
ncbi:hypothetical protein L1887_03216 [Cichorium endivia]|nr:hypothetical protein L1887_03216 [Cichorium endivia]